MCLPLFFLLYLFYHEQYQWFFSMTLVYMSRGPWRLAIQPSFSTLFTSSFVIVSKSTFLLLGNFFFCIFFYFIQLCLRSFWILSLTMLEQPSLQCKALLPRHSDLPILMEHQLQRHLNILLHEFYNNQTSDYLEFFHRFQQKNDNNPIVYFHLEVLGLKFLEFFLVNERFSQN